MRNRLTERSTILKLVLIALLLGALACGTVTNVTEEVQQVGEEPVVEEEEEVEEAPTEAPPVKVEEELPVYDLDDGYETVLVELIDMDSQVSGTFDSVFDAHNWLFEGTAGQTVQIAATGSGEVDTRIRLIDPDGNLLAEEDDTVGNDPLVSITLPTNGLYTVRVDTWSTGTYSLIVTEGEIAMSEEEAPEDIEPIEMAEEVDSSLPLFDMDDGYDTTLLQLIDINIPYSSTFNSVFDAHNWLFEGSAGQDIQVYATGIDEEVDTRARLIDPDGNLLTEEDDTMGVDPWITITLPDDGLYTVRIDTWSTGAYGMIVMEGEGAAVSGSSSGATIEQWAVRATASSQYTDTDWSASQATGETDTPECGDYDTAWASASATGVEWLQLEYATPVVPTTVVIYETYNPGALYQIDVIGVSGSQYTAYMTSPEIKAYCPMTRSFEIAGIDEKVDTVILYFDQSDHSGWNEIDAVMLIGTE